VTADPRRPDHPFALCLTHDVDRPYKSFVHSLYYAVRDRNPVQLRSLAPEINPYWQFDAVMRLEAELGVRSAFYFLSEPRLGNRSFRELLDTDTWVQLLGRYDVRSPEIADVIRRLADGGWEVGLHGSYGTADDRDRLRIEKNRIERVLRAEIRGGRQHYLDLEVPRTWRHHRAIGLDYDTSLGSSSRYGFADGFDVRRPFDDHFVVFPLTLMESALPDPGESFEAAWSVCESLLAEAEANGAVMTVLWHPRLFCSVDFPGYRQVYRRLVEAALDRGAWVGSPGTYYDRYLAGDERPAVERPRDLERFGADGRRRNGGALDRE
jgi:hypothetical protein